MISTHWEEKQSVQKQKEALQATLPQRGLQKQLCRNVVQHSGKNNYIQIAHVVNKSD